MKRALSAVAAAAVLCPAAAEAYTFAPGYTGGDAVTGFPSGEPTPPLGQAVGPWGLDFDPAGTLFVADRFDRNLYAFGSGGGAAGPGTLRGPLDDYVAADLAFDRAGRLFTARSGPVWDVVEIDPSDGHVLRTLAALPVGDYVKGAKVDPLSGDLVVLVFRSTDNTSRLARVTVPPAGAGVLTPYATLPGNDQADGLVFTRGGTMFANAGDQVYRVAGTDRPQPPAVVKVATVPNGDGMAVDQSSDPVDPDSVLVNRNDGRITRVDLTPGGPQYTDIVTGGTRGDSATVGPDGCLYATQTASILKVTHADGTCALTPLTPFPPEAVTGAAAAITTTTATLTGTADANGFDTTASIEYGRTPDALTAATPEQAVGHGTSPVAVDAAVTGLQPGTTYVFRVVATSRNGTARGALAQFTTAPAPPAATPPTEPVTPVTPATAPSVANPLPLARRCVSRRRFTIHLRVPAGAQVARAVVSVNRRRVRVVRADRLRARVNLTGLPKGRFTVRITLVLRDGRTLSGTRAYRTCAPTRHRPGTPRL